MATRHPHPDQRHIMVTYRRHILAAHRKFGSARGLIHYRGYVDAYLEAKRVCTAERLAATSKTEDDVRTE